MKKKTKKIILISLSAAASIIILLIILNIILRDIQPKDNYKSELLKIFPEEFTNTNFKIYKGGIIPTFSSITLCKSIYFKPSDIKDINKTNRLLIHEATHLYQVKKGFSKCISNGASSLFHQFRVYLSHGSRGYAYLYPLNPDNNIFSPKSYYNPEQEASMVEDYYYLKFQEGNVSYTNCYKCLDYVDRSTCDACSEFHSKDKIISELEVKYNNIIKKYS
tara:strand:+ start:739 stop:1398 length:660 start_codon:yes stop_codon:yes gene_type:complete